VQGAATSHIGNMVRSGEAAIGDGSQGICDGTCAPDHLAGTVSWARPLAAGDTGIIYEYNDHDQRLQLTAGLSHHWDNGLTVAGDIFYGTGYPQDALGLYNAVGIAPYGLTQQRVPRFLANLSLNYWPKCEPLSVEYGGSLQVLNLFDQHPLLNFFSDFSGTRFVSQRRILLNGMVRF